MKQFIAKPLAFTAFCLVTFAVTAFAGADSYTIYLNNKLILKQYVHQAGLKLDDLQLSEAKAGDNLVVFYSHCGEVGKGRSVAIKDAAGNTIKEWKFADAEGKDAGMTIPINELLALEKKHAGKGMQIFYYSSKFLPKGTALAGINLNGKKTAWLNTDEGGQRLAELAR
ncbi:hypothetical protein [Foetidibacter luteolus]|uniref:hypothetical protein n=1 Tax=Foetidibacter luteolus TaxID=2608880 RepID=UPI00129ADB15|nr:hypothetical protein [Foetidibacter luteolus]